MKVNYKITAVIISFISILCGIVAYFGALNLLVGLGVLIVCLAFGFLIFLPATKNYLEKSKKRHELYLFINAFIISLSTNDSLERAYSSASESFKDELKTVNEDIAAFTIEERLNYLRNYFNDNSYEMFLSLLRLYSEQGGDILKISSGLFEEVSAIEDSAITISRQSKRHIIEFFILWGMSLLILGMLRFSLRNLTSSINGEFMFLISVILFFVVFILSVFLLFKNFYGIDCFVFIKKKNVRRSHEEIKREN